MAWFVSFNRSSLVLLFAAFLLSFGGRFHFMLDNLSSFRMHFVLGFLAIFIATLVTRQRLWLGIASAGLLASLVPVVPWYLPAGQKSTDGEEGLTVLSANVFAFNDSADKLVGLVIEEAPDLFGLVELNPKFARGLASLHSEYQHRFEVPASGYDGIGLYSRFPLTNSKVLPFGDDLPSSISAVVESQGQHIEIIVAHPNAPMTSDLAKQRNRQLRLLSEHVGNSGRESILLGDLNVAMWSPYYGDLVKKAGLKNARNGWGIGGSWPPVAGFGVPIDHILSTSKIELREFRVLPSIGSDHLPIAARVVVVNGT